MLEKGRQAGTAQQLQAGMGMSNGQAVQAGMLLQASSLGGEKNGRRRGTAHMGVGNACPWHQCHTEEGRRGGRNSNVVWW